MSRSTGRYGLMMIFALSPIFIQAAQSVPEVTQPPAGPNNPIANPGFEDAADGVPAGWTIDTASSKGRVELDSANPRTGKLSLKLSPNENNTDKDDLLGVVQLLTQDSIKGKRYRLSSSMRSTGDASATLIAIVFKADDQMGQSLFLTSTWARSDYIYADGYFYIDPDAKGIVIGCSVSGTSGSAYFDDISMVEDEPLTISKPDKPLTASIDVNAGKVLRTIPKSLFGTNVEWTWNAAGLWDPERNRLRQEIVEPAKELGLGPVRFPGGFFSDYYHWRDSIGPQASRPSREHSPGSDVSRNVFGTDELAEFCQVVGAEPLITVNMITGTPQEAADWIKYCNQPKHPERLKNGSAKPYNIRFWEIGNEQYLKGDDAVGKTSHLPTDEYIRRYLEWSSAMKKADPSIKIVAVGASNYGRYTMSYDEDWNKKLLEQAGHAIDYLAVHNAYAPAGVSSSNASFYEVYQALLTFPVLIKANLDKISSQIDTYAPKYKDRIKIGVTEWAPLFHILPTDKWIDHCKTLGSGIYVASTMKAFLDCPKVELANSFKLSEYAFMGWINGDGTPKPSYYALQMYTKHFGDKVVETSVNSPTYTSKGAAQIDAVKDAPYLEAISSLSPDKSKLYIIVINKHFTAPIKVSLNLNGFVPKPTGKAWVLTAPSLDANNGKDLIEIPGLNWAKQIEAPDNPMFESGKPGTVVTRETVLNGASGKFEYTFPPISVTCLEMTRR